MSDPNEWDGPEAQRFRSDWPKESEALRQAVADLEQLQKQAQQIVQDILRAGS